MKNLIPRRSFLRSATIASSGLALAPGLGIAAEALASSKGQRPIKKGIMYATVGIKGSVLEKFKAVKDAGFHGIEPMGGMDQEEVMQAFAETGLKAASVCCHSHWDKPVSSPNPEVRAAGVAGLKQTLKDAKRYGASSVLFVPAVVNKQVSYADAYSRSQAEIRKVLPLAEELGIKIAIENVWNGFLLSPLEAARYIDEFNSPAIGWHFDVGNVINFGWPEQWIRILGKRIQKLHIKEYSRAKRDKSGPYAGFQVEYLEGDNDWPTIMKALDEIGYTGWGIAEQPGGNSPEGLKNLSDRMTRIFAS
jgi:hexulose-6-phosphate isomerase